MHHTSYTIYYPLGIACVKFTNKMINTLLTRLVNEK